MEVLVELSLLRLSPSSDIDCYFCASNVQTFLPPDSSPVQLVLPTLHTTGQLVSGDSSLSSPPFALDSCFLDQSSLVQSISLSSPGGLSATASLSMRIVNSGEQTPSCDALDDLLETLRDRKSTEEQLRANVKQLQSILKTSYEARDELQTLIKESADQAQTQILALSKEVTRLNREKEETARQLDEERAYIGKLKAENSGVQQQNELLKTEVETLRKLQTKEPPKMPVLKESSEVHTAVDSMAKQLAEVTEYSRQLDKAKGVLALELKQTKASLIALQQETTQTKTELAKVKGGASSLTLELVQQSSDLDKVKIENEALRKELQSLQAHFDRLVQASKEMQLRLTQTLQAFEESQTTKNTLANSLKNTETELFETREANIRLELQVKTLGVELEQVKAQLKTETIRQSENQSNLQDYYEQLTEQLKNQLAAAEQVNCSQQTHLDTSIKRLTSEKQALSTQVAEFQQLNTKLVSEKSTLFRQKEEALMEVARLEQYLCAVEDLSQMVDNLQHQIQVHESTHTKLSEEVHSLNDLVSLQSKRNNSANQRISELTEQISKQEAVIQALRIRLSNAHYVPVKDDPIDQAMANYINSREKRLEVPFVREDTGIYSFGTKRVFVKLEQGNVIIRVGGGFMMIDEFIDFHTLVELEKIEGKQKRRQDSARLSLIDKYRDATSPRWEGDLAPREAAKIIREQVAEGKFTTMYGIKLRNSPTKGMHTPPMRKVKSVRRLSDLT